MRPLPLPSTTRAFWELIGQGVAPLDAGVAVGVSAGTGRRWFADSGGVKPRLTDIGPRRRPRLSFEEREEISVGVAAQESVRHIARRLGRAPSTISREIKRNSPPGRNHYRPQYRFGARWRGGPLRRPRVPRPAPLKPAVSAVLAARSWVSWQAASGCGGRCKTRLDQQHSPEQIAVRLRLDFPDDPEMWVSHETIYQSIYVQGRGQLRRELHRCLRTGRALRRPQRRVAERRGRIQGMVNISERPPEVADRAVPGHWEGDLIVGAESKSAIGTLVERTTRFVMLLHLPDDHGALAVQNAIVDKMTQLPEHLRRSLTWDQGTEMSNHLAIAEAAALDIYFCDPHSPWQRGSNENTNGLLRQYFAKGTDLSVFPADYLDFVATKLNTRPRKTLAWKTPAEALDELLSQPFKPPDVASTA